MMKQGLTRTGLILLVAMMSPTAQAAPAAEKSGQPLSPETEMAIMRVMNQRIAFRRYWIRQRCPTTSWQAIFRNLDLLHHDWMDRARKVLGVTASEDQ